MDTDPFYRVRVAKRKEKVKSKGNGKTKNPKGKMHWKLKDSFNPFIMNEINKTLSQLLSMLRTAESNTKGWIQIHSIKSAKRKERKVIRSKVNGKTKTKGKWIETHGDISKDGKCFHHEKSGQ